MLKKSKLALAIAGAITLAGCDFGPSDAEITKEVNNQVDKIANQKVLSQFGTERKELNEMLIEMKQKDPSIEELYYTVDPQGERMLNVVREDESGDFVTYALLGAAAGAMLSSNSSSTNNLHSHNQLHSNNCQTGHNQIKKSVPGQPTMKQDNCQRSTSSNRHGGAGGYYGSYLASNASETHRGTKASSNQFATTNRRSYTAYRKTQAVQSIKSNPTRMSNMRRGAMSRMSSSRSSGYSAGRGA
ncbi:hypothetical protein [Neptuniibacter sp. QD37_11]|uniref:hypothetical protein n=1 Tax=Neptuniibacter sp. QD37_11 TaxID=3398209 RepID=UPI0039F5C320